MDAPSLDGVYRLECMASSSQNSLIGAMPRADQQTLLSRCESVPFEFAQVLAEPGSRSRFVYFPTEGFLSLVQLIDGNAGLEVGMVGDEGMVGTQLVLGIDMQPLRVVAQGRGTALRIRSRTLLSTMRELPKFKLALDRYIGVLFVQLSRSAACSSYHQIQPRLARWLLMTHDRARCDRFSMTHELLAYMLGVRREGITAAAGALMAAGLIHYRRGDVQVLDRAGLEAAACSCYAANQAIAGAMRGGSVKK